METIEVSDDTRERWILINQADRQMMMLEYAYRTSKESRTARQYVQAMFTLAIFAVTFGVLMVML